jgi:hypothetical protein
MRATAGARRRAWGLDLITIGVLHIVVPKGTPLLIGNSLGDIARQISTWPASGPGTAMHDRPYRPKTGTIT